MLIIQRRNIYRDEVRRYCIQLDWYKSGTNDEYEAMLTRCDGTFISVQDLYEIARDILEHTFAPTVIAQDNIMSVMGILATRCCKTTFEVVDEDQERTKNE